MATTTVRLNPLVAEQPDATPGERKPRWGSPISLPTLCRASQALKLIFEPVVVRVRRSHHAVIELENQR